MAIVRKLFHGLGVLWGALTLVFLLFSSVPDPARALAGQNEREEVVEAIREKHGLNDALHVRYARFFLGFIPFAQTPKDWHGPESTWDAHLCPIARWQKRSSKRFPQPYCWHHWQWRWH